MSADFKFTSIDSVTVDNLILKFDNLIPEAQKPLEHNSKVSLEYSQKSDNRCDLTLSFDYEHYSDNSEFSEFVDELIDHMYELSSEISRTSGSIVEYSVFRGEYDSGEESGYICAGEDCDEIGIELLKLGYRYSPGNNEALASSWYRQALQATNTSPELKNLRIKLDLHMANDCAEVEISDYDESYRSGLESELNFPSHINNTLKNALNKTVSGNSHLFGFLRDFAEGICKTEFAESNSGLIEKLICIETSVRKKYGETCIFKVVKIDPEQKNDTNCYLDLTLEVRRCDYLALAETMVSLDQFFSEFFENLESDFFVSATSMFIVIFDDCVTEDGEIPFTYYNWESFCKPLTNATETPSSQSYDPDNSLADQYSSNAEGVTISFSRLDLPLKDKVYNISSDAIDKTISAESISEITYAEVRQSLEILLSKSISMGSRLRSVLSAPNFDLSFDSDGSTSLFNIESVHSFDAEQDLHTFSEQISVKFGCKKIDNRKNIYRKKNEGCIGAWEWIDDGYIHYIHLIKDDDTSTQLKFILQISKCQDQYIESLVGEVHKIKRFCIEVYKRKVYVEYESLLPSLHLLLKKYGDNLIATLEKLDRYWGLENFNSKTFTPFKKDMDYTSKNFFKNKKFVFLGQCHFLEELGIEKVKSTIDKMGGHVVKNPNDADVVVWGYNVDAAYLDADHFNDRDFTNGIMKKLL